MGHLEPYWKISAAASFHGIHAGGNRRSLEKCETGARHILMTWQPYRSVDLDG
ncbi:hypothetical protein HMPREF1246_0517 [Acidaminococcus sp. BV3L6]|nr:hypothetical protein HMPREF1246_0517 [Acidaminococcus sp. BV3L6]